MNRFLKDLAQDIKFAPFFINVKKRPNCHFDALQFSKLNILNPFFLVRLTEVHSRIIGWNDSGIFNI